MRRVSTLKKPKTMKNGNVLGGNLIASKEDEKKEQEKTVNLKLMDSENKLIVSEIIRNSSTINK